METLNQPGSILREARERGGWNVADVVHRTKIPRTIVEALESDDYTVFSSPTYARSYLSQYAEFLGVDAERWLDFFEPGSFAAPKDVLSMIESPAEPEAHHSHSGSRHGGSGSILPTVLLLMLTGGLIYGAVSGYAYLEKKMGESAATKSAASPAATAPAAESTNAAVPNPAAAPAPAAPSVPPTVAPPVAVTPPAEGEKAPRATIVIEE